MQFFENDTMIPPLYWRLKARKLGMNVSPHAVEEWSADCLVFKMAADCGDLVKFAPFSSAVDVAFWHKLKEKKIEEYQLDDKPRKLQGNFTNG